MARVKCPHCFHVNPDRQESCEKCGARLPRISIEAPGPARAPAQVPGRSQLQFHRGQVVAGRYTVLNLIGQGGMGSIYKVHDNTLGEDVALKTLLPQFLQDKVVLERFYNEAKIARRLAHPNIVRVHDIGEDGKILYISMEYLQGMSLREILDNLPPGERLPIAQTMRIFDQLCAALEYAHQFTVHRDIKPENVMLGQDGAVRLMDFGISKLMANTRLTNASIVMGTPFYMSPEQIRNSRDVDARADIYSVGVMLYEILTGSVPTGVPKPASQITKDVPPALDKIVARCVEPDPKDRYQNAAELRQALQPITQQIRSGINTSKTRLTRRIGTGEYSPRKILAGIAVAAILMGGLWGLGQAEQHRRAVLAEAAAQDGEAAGGAEAAATAEPSFAHYRAIMKTLQPLARERAGRPGLNGAVAEGDRHWAAAEAATDEPRAIASARRALQCYLAPLAIRDGMVFVPPGPVSVGGATAELPGFLIDETEVTVADYARFAEDEANWSVPAELAGRANHPITLVSGFDAMAYAAWRGAELPTEAQWARAAYGDQEPPDYPWEGEPDPELVVARFDGGAGVYTPGAVRSREADRSHFGCFDMAGNASEWTRTCEPPLAAGEQPDYQSYLVTRGGNANEAPRPWTTRFPFPLMRSDPNLGFRCVVPVPDDPGAALSLLQAGS